MERDATITLVSETEQPNAYGALVAVETRREGIPCKVRDAYRSEFLSGQQYGIAENFVFLTNPVNYKDEKILEYNGKRYAIIRPHLQDSDVMELHAGLKVGVRDGSN